MRTRTRVPLSIVVLCLALILPAMASADGHEAAEAAKGYSITKDEFDWTAAHLVEALDHFKVPDAEKNELVGIVSSMQDDIVEED